MSVYGVKVTMSNSQADVPCSHYSQIKAALWNQAFIGNTLVSCPIGPVVAIRRRKGQLLAMIRGWGRWYPVESVRIERIGMGRQLLS
jgi:hypothetical protein